MTWGVFDVTASAAAGRAAAAVHHPLLLLLLLRGFLYSGGIWQFLRRQFRSLLIGKQGKIGCGDGVFSFDGIWKLCGFLYVPRRWQVHFKSSGTRRLGPRIASAPMQLEVNFPRSLFGCTSSNLHVAYAGALDKCHAHCAAKSLTTSFCQL